MTAIRAKALNFTFGVVLGCVLAFPATPVMAQGQITTPANPIELHVEIEVETGIGSLKQEPTWKEFVQMLEDPYLAPLNGSNQAPSAVVRRPRFPPPLVYGTGGAFETDPMPALNVWPLGYNFLTAQPMRAKYHEAGVIESDAEISWDNPGPLFDPDEAVATNTTDPNNENVPIALRTKIGGLVACTGTTPVDGFSRGNPCADVEDLAEDLFGLAAADALAVTDGFLVVNNPSGNGVRNFYGYGGDGLGQGSSDGRIPPHRTVVAVPVVVGDTLYEAEIEFGEFELEEVVELEAPVNEEHFIKGRRMAEDLGKALFWDMQVGSDGVQACGTCHFHAGVDNRTRNQLNPNHIGAGPDNLTLELYSQRSATGGPVVVDPQDNNQDVVASDFPFHQTSNHRRPAEPLFRPGNVTSDHNDVMSSMGVSRWTLFVDVIVGTDGFGPAFEGVQPLLPDSGTIADDPIPLMQGLRRVEPRNTPTMHAAAFNHDNFWDGRARFHFNGGSVFGQTDPFYHIYVNPVGGPLAPMTNPDEVQIEEGIGTWVGGDEPIRIKFSSLASQAVGPPLSDFEMAFAGRNWAKIGKKLLQPGVTPLANQLVAINDSRIGRWSNQGGSACAGLPPGDWSGDGMTAVGKPGLCISYPAMIRGAFPNRLWNSANRHLNGTPVPMDNSCDPGEQIEGGMTPTCDPFDGYVLEIANGAAAPANTSQFTQMEANFSLFFAQAVQAYEVLLIPDDTPFDRFLDANPRAGFAIGQPGEQGVLFPTLIPSEVNVGSCPAGTIRNGVICLIPDNPATPEFDGFGQRELLGFDIFAGANLTAALRPGATRNPEVTITNEAGTDITIAVGSNPFARTSRCMLCHLGPAQTDHSNTIAHGIIKGDAEFEFPVPPQVADPRGNMGATPDECFFSDCLLPAPESPGIIAAVGGLVLAEEVAETSQDAVEVEPVNFNATGSLVERIIAAPDGFAFGDQGIYNVGLRPDSEDIGRGGDGAFGMPLALTALTLLNVAQEGYQLCDNAADAGSHPNGCNMTNFNPALGAGGGLFGETGSDQRVNPGLEREPELPTLPEYLAEWTNAVPAGELHPQIDEMAGFAPNTLTAPNGGPAIEFPENLFGADLHCGRFDPGIFGAGPPNFGWGPTISDDDVCPNPQSGVPNNMGPENPADLAVYVAGSLVAPIHGTWPFPNRLRRDGNFKAPQLRNVELSGPYFHTGSYLTLRQVTEFYLRGGDFPVTNAESRDQNMVHVDVQAFGFGSTKPVSNGGPIPNSFADALPDTRSQYDPMPDTDHPFTPEPAYMDHNFVATSIVRYLLSLTDPRVAHRSQPFDQPEIFVPIDGTAPENTGGRVQLVADARFLQVPATGRPGQAAKLANFLGVSSTQLGSQVDCASSGGTSCDHFDIR